MSRALALIGADGRMGREILREISICAEWTVHAAVVSPASVKASAAAQGGIEYTSDLGAIGGAAVAIDFSAPESSVLACEASAAAGVPIVVATTGHSAEQHARILSATAQTAVLLAPNTSMGIFALHRAAQVVQQIVGARSEIEISEIHHRGKKDSPSGTALNLARALQGAGDSSVVAARTGARRSGEIGVSSVRGGSVAGEHTIHFLMDGERLELTHRAENRSIFARGALEFAARLIGRAPGLYEVDDLLR